MKHYVSKYAACPFYSQEEPKKIHCEGFDKSCRIQVSFEDRGGIQRHKRLYCYTVSGYKQCPLYPVIAKQYEEEKE